MQGMMISSLGEWTVPSISGQCCPPTNSFVVENINNTKGIIFGGRVNASNGDAVVNTAYVVEIIHNTIVSCTVSVDFVLA